jgi:hypothetical protein
MWHPAGPGVGKRLTVPRIGIERSQTLGKPDRTRPQHRAIKDYYTDWRGRLDRGAPIPANAHLRPPNLCWSCKELVNPASKACPGCGAPVQGGDATALRYLVFLCFEVRKHQESGRLTLAAADDCLSDANARIRALRTRMDRQRVPLAEAAPEPQARAARLAEVLGQTSADEEPILDALPVAPARRDAPPPPPPLPRRSLLEILLDPRSIQWLLASGGALLVVGLLVWLAAEGIFTNRLFVAMLLGAGTGAMLLGGWTLIRFTSHEIAGRALTLLACLVMPFNVWFYDAQDLVTLGDLWIPAVICCGLYAVSARLLRDPTFVWVFVLGVAGTGLLLLAGRGLFWEIGSPSTLLVALGLLAIHAERVFPANDGPFSRRRFGLAFFWSGHLLLGTGLLLLFGAYLFGDWMYSVFRVWYDLAHAGPPAVVTDPDGRLVSLALVLAGTYAYAYSDLVVRRVGAYLYAAVGTLLWTEVLALRFFDWQIPTIEVVIIALALTGLAANLTLKLAASRESGLLRAGPPLALVLSTLPVLLGVVLHFRATTLAPGVLRYPIGPSYVGAMLAVMVSCRIGAFLYRKDNPVLSAIYFFGTGAATMVGAAGLLLVKYKDSSWDFQAPILMVIPVLYLLVARLYRGLTPERPLVWVAHAATGVMLLSSVGAAFKGFGLVPGNNLIAGTDLNLTLALFFGEVAAFYALEAAWRRHAFSVYLCTLAACAAVWQVLKFYQIQEEYFILAFAVVGLALLIAYRFAVLERAHVAGLAGAAFQCGNALLSLSFVCGALMILSELVLEEARRSVLLPLLSALIVIALLAVALVRQEGWRRWYVAMAITHASLSVLVLAVLSHLTPGERLEVVCVVTGLLLLAAGHLGWFREQDEQTDLVSIGLVFGSLLVAFPLTIAVLTCRVKQAFESGYEADAFHTLNEVAMLAVGLVLLATGFICRIKSTTLAGGFLMAVYLLTLVLYLKVPRAAQTTAVYIMAGGGLFFGIGLLLSLYRDRLLQLPERIKRREGVFRVLTWR